MMAMCSMIDIYLHMPRSVRNFKKWSQRQCLKSRPAESASSFFRFESHYFLPLDFFSALAFLGPLPLPLAFFLAFFLVFSFFSFFFFFSLAFSFLTFFLAFSFFPAWAFSGSAVFTFFSSFSLAMVDSFR